MKKSLLTLLFVVLPITFAVAAQTQNMRVASLNNVLKCDSPAYSGSTLGDKLISCAAALPSTGGTLDATGFRGAQSFSSSTISITKPITLLLGAVTISTSNATAFTITSAFTLEGIKGLTTIVQTGVSHVVVSTSTINPVIVKNVVISSSNLGQTSGAAIILDGTGSGSDNNQSRFENIQFLYQWIGIDSRRAISWVVRDCNFNGITSRGIKLKNDDTADGGDIFIGPNNIFSPKTIGAGTTAIELVAASGVFIHNNKFFSHKYDVSVSADTSSGSSAGMVQLQFISNTSEAKESTGAVLNFASTSGTLLNITVSSNHYQTDATNYGNFINFASGSGFRFGVCNITGNIHYMTTNGTSMVFAGNGNGDVCNVANNIVTDTTGGGASAGISVGTGYSRMGIGPNFLLGLTTPASITTGATSPVTVSSPLTVSGQLLLSDNIKTSDCAVIANGSNIAACGSSISGSTTIRTGQTSVQINTTAITGNPNARIFVVYDNSLNTKLGVTCNIGTSISGSYYVNVRDSVGGAFTLSTDTAPVTNPACLNWWVVR